MGKDKSSINQNKNISLFDSLTPIVLLVLLLYINVNIYGDLSIDGSNQFILLIGAALAYLVGFKNNVSSEMIFENVSKNIKSISSPIIILLLVGALSGTWLISGIIPSMIYYGFNVINASFFLPSCVIISAIVALATGSSWSTSATIGIALIGIGKALGFDIGIVAGAVISGAYFGDKMSPLSDTTNLAAAVSGSDLFEHIKYMTITTVPTICVALIFFVIYNLINLPQENLSNVDYIESINDYFYISPPLFIVPLIVIFMIYKKVNPIVSLFVGTILAALFSLIFQSELISNIILQSSSSDLTSYNVIMDSIIAKTTIQTNSVFLDDLLTSGGMSGMLNTIWLVICAMIFGGVMEAIGALRSISLALLSIAKSTINLFASTILSCITVNITASDQYLSIVIPGKMFSNSYNDRKLSSLNLSRTIEDSGTVTSVLIPWNTCGAYQASVLNVNVQDYFVYAIFNWLSPIATLIVASLNYKIKRIAN